MLASLTDRIFVVISRERIAIMHIRLGFFKRYIISEKSVEVVVSEGEVVEVKNIIDTLTITLQSQKIDGAKLEVLLAGDLVRMDMLPALRQALKPEEQTKRAQIHFERVYGAVAKTWAFKTAFSHFDQPVLAASIEQSLLRQLQVMAETCNLQLVKVEPVVIRILRYWKKQLKNQSAQFIVVERSLCSLITLNRQGVITIVQAPYSGKLTAQFLQNFLTRENLRQLKDDQTEFLYFNSSGKTNILSEIQGLKVTHFKLPNSIKSSLETQLMRLHGLV